jgi:purine-binding chemotaxis protein CheW
VINFRGKIIPLADLRLAFDMEPSQTTIDSRIVVIETAIDGEEHWLGFRADKVLEVAGIAPSSCEEPPMVGMRWNRNHVRCLARRGEGVIVIPDLPAIFEPTLRSVAPGMAAAA